MKVLVHCAGELLDGLQSCVHCALVLNDYRYVMWPEGQPAPQGWEEGAFVRKEGGHSMVVEDAGGLRCETRHLFKINAAIPLFKQGELVRTHDGREFVVDVDQIDLDLYPYIDVTDSDGESWSIKPGALTRIVAE